MSYTYSTLLTAVANALTVDPGDADFVALLPTILDDAEQRCYRELDLLTANVTVSQTLIPNTRINPIPTTSGHMLVLDAINVFSTAGARFSPPVKMVSRDVVDFLWPNESAPSAASFPVLAARIDDLNVMFGPAPGSPWGAEFIGTIRPAPLSVTNTSTFLTNYLSDLFFKCIMADANGVLLKNYGAQSSDPQQAISWEAAYQAVMASAKTEELRKMYISANSPLPASAKA